MRLFLEQGFDRTTVEQIAAEAGLSRTSFFRYFATKEDVVLGHFEELGHRILEVLVARPAEEPVWQALRNAFELLIEESSGSPEQGLRTARMLHDTQSLKARLLSKQLSWQDLLESEVARRLGIGSEVPDPRPRALVGAALACLNAAVDVWIATDGAVGLPVLFDEAMSALTS
jgi:AcrR family transcriptional regulator